MRAGARVEARARAADAMSCSSFRGSWEIGDPGPRGFVRGVCRSGWPAGAGRRPRSRAWQPPSTAPSCRTTARPRCARRSGRRGGRPRPRRVGAGPGPWRCRRPASWLPPFSLRAAGRGRSPMSRSRRGRAPRMRPRRPSPGRRPTPLPRSGPPLVPRHRERATMRRRGRPLRPRARSPRRPQARS
jgi:hypothetical protein